MLRYIILSVILGFAICVEGQVVLQLERFNVVKTDKYLPSDMLIYKTKEFPDIWQRRSISEIYPVQNNLILEGDILSLNDITKVSQERHGVKLIGQKLSQFGIAWFAFAAILDLTNRYEIGTDTLIIGGSAIALGQGMKALFFRKTFTIGKNSRLRILDLNAYSDF